MGSGPSWLRYCLLVPWSSAFLLLLFSAFLGLWVTPRSIPFFFSFMFSIGLLFIPFFFLPIPFPSSLSRNLSQAVLSSWLVGKVSAVLLHSRDGTPKPSTGCCRHMLDGASVTTTRASAQLWCQAGQRGQESYQHSTKHAPVVRKLSLGTLAFNMSVIYLKWDAGIAVGCLGAQSF